MRGMEYAELHGMGTVEYLDEWDGRCGMRGRTDYELRDARMYWMGDAGCEDARDGRCRRRSCMGWEMQDMGMHGMGWDGREFFLGP